MNKSILLILFSFVLLFSSLLQAQQPRVKTIVTTDGEIDDVDTFIRMLLYTNEFELEGLVYSSSMWHYRGDGKATPFISKMEMTKNMYGEQTDLRWPGTNWIQELIEEYAKIYPNLLKHSATYPSPEKLMRMVKVGNVNFEGEMELVTSGSEWIKNKLLDPEIKELFLQAWGGTNTIARSLKSIEEAYSQTALWDEVYEAVSQKASIYTIMDQDDTYINYISKKWPKIRVYYNAHQFAAFAYPWQQMVPSKIQAKLKGGFMGPEIIQNHGPLLKKYYSYGDGQKQQGDDEHIHGDLTKLKNAQWGSFDLYDFISEGDTPAYLHLVDVGLDNYNNPSYGGWGGRFVQSKTNPSKFEDGETASDFNPETQRKDPYYPQSRWVEVIQNDFAARADWCIKSFENANHPPSIHVEQPSRISAKSGETVILDFNSGDIDGDQITHSVWNYSDLSTAPVEVTFNQKQAKIKLGSNAASGNQVHIIVEGTDNGIPKLTRYQRILIEVD